MCIFIRSIYFSNFTKKRYLEIIDDNFPEIGLYTKKVYHISRAEAIYENLIKIKNYINNNKYYKLNSLYKNIPMVEDSLGDTINTNLYDVILMKSPNGIYEIYIFYFQLVGSFNIRLVDKFEVYPFPFMFFFMEKSKIYP